MPRYVAFLRAINVGGHVVRMDQLRALFGSLGFSEVETFIASGNVIFVSSATDARALEQKIEAHLQRALGYPVTTFLRSLDELSAIAHHQPFKADDDGPEKSTTYIVLLSKTMTAAARRQLLAFNSDVDQFAVKGREIYWRHRGATFESPFSGAQLERIAAGPGTMRNRNTIVRLARKYPCPDPKPATVRKK
jgi:uncharacterized protein (DUF1697 family)